MQSMDLKSMALCFRTCKEDVDELIELMYGGARVRTVHSGGGRYVVDIQIDPHTLARAEERGTTEEEIHDAIHTGFSVPGKYGRMGRGKAHDFNQVRHGRYYEQKRIEVFYTIETYTVITVTVYVFYGKWETQNADSL